MRSPKLFADAGSSFVLLGRGKAQSSFDSGYFGSRVILHKDISEHSSLGKQPECKSFGKGFLTVVDSHFLQEIAAVCLDCASGLR